MADGLKLGLYGLHRGSSADPETMARRARLTEEAGFESLWVGDHIALPAGMPDPAVEPRMEAVIALTYLAALTTRVRLCLGVIVLPQRQPVPSFQGRFVEFADVVQRPRPVQRPHPPVVIGGESPSALRRAALAGNGWYGWELDPDATAKALAELRATAERHQRPAELGELEITITPPQGLDLDVARRYADLGVHRLAIVPPTTEDTAIDDLIAWTGDTLAGKV